jgi:hypothetical protein
MNFKEWGFDRYLRLAGGIAIITASVLARPAHMVLFVSAGAGFIITAVSNSCPFNACAVKVPVKKEDKNDGKVG